MSQYKLTYFNVTALGETIRWIFKYAKVDFEDERINFEDWPNEKSRFGSGQLPFLLEDGKELSQASAIIRYLGKKYGLTNGDDWLDYLVDQTVDIVTDGRVQWLPVIMETDEQKKEQGKQRLLANVYPTILKQLDGILKGQGGPFITGAKVTYGDFFLANWLHIWVNTVSTDLLNGYPLLERQLEAVLAIPEIKDWVAHRPSTFI